MTQPIYKPLDGGGYRHGDTFIYVDKNTLGLARGSLRGKTEIYELPEYWRLCEAVEDPRPVGSRLAVPIDDIERILREHDAAYGFRRESNLMVRRVQRWLDMQPKVMESKVSE